MRTSPLNWTVIAALLAAAVLFGRAANSPAPSAALAATADHAAPAAPAAAAAPVPVPPDPVLDIYVNAMRADLSDGKVKLVERVMKLGGDEANVFWPAYVDYESELFELGDQRVEVIRRFAAAQRSGKLEPRDAAELADGYFKVERQRLDLLKKYHDLLAKDLSPVRAAQFTQIEHRVGTVVDLMIAAELPLIRSAAEAPPAAKANEK
jgi:hypothetical protein